MKIEINTAPEAILFAKKLRTCCAASTGSPLKVGPSLEIVASLFGHANWDTMNGVLMTMPSAPSARPVEKPAVLGGSAINLYWEVEEPGSSFLGWAKIPLSASRLQALASHAVYAELCQTHQRCEDVPVQAWAWSRYAPAGDVSLCVNPDEELYLVMGSDSTDRTVLKTAPLTYSALQSLVDTAREEGRENIYVATDMDELKAQLDQAEEVCFCCECEAEYQAGGDGYDGMCPDCADEKENTSD